MMKLIITAILSALISISPTEVYGFAVGAPFHSTSRHVTVRPTAAGVGVVGAAAIGVGNSDNDAATNTAAAQESLESRVRRRTFLRKSVSVMLLAVSTTRPCASLAAEAPASSLGALSLEVRKARAQLEPIPDLIQQEKWDAVRAILGTPPLSDCWSKGAQSARSFLKRYAEAVDDELAALEANEDALSHLRYLDMAVYNNVFNPIKTEGTNGATKELIRSYYEDPLMEYQASRQALDALVGLGGGSAGEAK